jgi:hypothetical protein
MSIPQIYLEIRMFNFSFVDSWDDFLLFVITHAKGG